MRKFFTFLLALAASVGMSWALTPLSGDDWDDASKTLTVNSNPGGDAYKGQSEIEHVIISDAVTSIGDQAFRQCTALTSITIGNNVESIGARAFLYCIGLTSITIPNSVTSIGNGAFNSCTGLFSANIGNSVESIGNLAFYYCTNLTSVTIPNSVTSIGEQAFADCSGLTSITIPNSVTSIEVGTFMYCSDLTSVTIPNSVESIGETAFYGCSALTSITIPASVTSIGDGVFYDCDNLTDIYTECSNVEALSTLLYGDPRVKCLTPAVPVADLSKNIAIDLRNQQLGGDGETGGSKYLIIDSENNYTYVDDEPAAYNAYFQFQNFNGIQHGYTNLLITVPVEAGNYLLTLGGCQYGTGNGNVKSASNAILAEFDQKTAACFNGNPAQNSVSMIFTVDAAQNITIDCGNWTPYFAIEKMAAVPAFTDFEIDLRSHQLGGDSQTGGAKYLTIAGDSYTYVDAEPSAYNAYFVFDNFNGSQHGYFNLLATVPVKAGDYRLTLGTCQYGTGTGNVKSATNAVLANFDQKTAACYDANPAENIVVVNFTVDIDQPITIDCGNYTPYMKLERIKEIPAFKNFAIDLRSHQLGGDSQTGGAKYFTITGDAYNYLDVEPEAYNAYFVFDNFNGSQHGYTNLLATVPVKAGDYRLTLGTCQYGSGNGNVKSAADAILANFDQKTAACYDADPANNIVVANFTVAEDQLITIDCGNYTPYIKLEQVLDVDITPNEDPQHAGVYYSTFFDSQVKYELPAGVEAYAAVISGNNLNLTKIAEEGDVIPAGEAVILKSSVSPFTLTPSNEDAVAVGDNDLQGTDVSMTTPTNCYVLAGNEGVGFYRYNAVNLNPHKAYVIFSGAAAPIRMPFVFDAATGVEEVGSETVNTVRSEKLIENGVLYIIKNGVRYNAQGQIVK